METFQRIRESAEYDLQHQHAPLYVPDSELTHLPEGYGPGVNVLKCKIILGLDHYPQLTDGLVLCNPDWEGTIGLIAEDPTREQDLVRHAGHDIGARTLAFGKFRNLIPRPLTLWNWWQEI
jgi:hypothetical protein